MYIRGDKLQKSVHLYLYSSVIHKQTKYKMKVKQWALCFVFLLSSHYLMVAAAQVGASQKKGTPKKKTTGSGECCSSASCNVTPKLAKKLDQAFENIREKLPNSISINNATLEDNLVANGKATGFQNFRIVGPYRCECGGKEFARIIVDVSFLQILLDFVLYMLKDLLGGLLGPLGYALAVILGDVGELLVKLLGLNIEVQIVVLQEFIPGTTASVENFNIGDVSDITLLHIPLFFLADLLSPILTPVLNLLLEIMLEGPVKSTFLNELQKIVIAKDEVICSH